jgi:hypothetical protein
MEGTSELGWPGGSAVFRSLALGAVAGVAGVAVAATCSVQLSTEQPQRVVFCMSCSITVRHGSLSGGREMR